MYRNDDTEQMRYSTKQYIANFEYLVMRVERRLFSTSMFLTQAGKLEW